MSKLILPRSAVEKLVARFKGIFSDHGIAPTERDQTIMRWYDEQLSDELNPIDRILKELGILKPGWDRPLSQIEMHELHGSLETLRDFTPREWEVIRRFLAYTPKSYEKLWQVKSRQWFLQAPVDTLTAAETWEDANKPRVRKVAPVNESAGTVLSREEALAILRGDSE